MPDSMNENLNEQPQDNAPADDADMQEPQQEDAGTASPLEEELNKVKDQLLRALADAENTRRRAVKEREDASKFAISNFAKDLLDVADNFARALDSVPDDLKGQDERIDNLLTGIEATQQNMLKAFEKHGIQELDPLDKPFDPNFHEVMFEAEMPDKPAGTVIQVIEVGYVIKDRLLRPARVGVAKTSGAPSGVDQEV